MKSLLLTYFIFSSSFLAFSNEVNKDTLIIKVGDRTKVIIYGKTKADLKDLEEIDLNKALREMNKNLEAMPLNTQKIVFKDYNGEMYMTESPKLDQSEWSRFVKKTNVNFHAAWLDLGYYDLTGFDQSEGLRYEAFNGTKNPLNLGVSIFHGEVKKLNNNFGFAFKKGIQYNYFLAESSIPSFNGLLGGTSEDLLNFSWDNVVKNELTYSDAKNNSLIQTITLNNGTTLQSQALPKRHTFGTLSAELKPTFYMFNKKGVSTFSVSPGAFVGLKLHQKAKTHYLNLSEDNKRSGSSVSSPSDDFGKINMGFQFDVSYKVVHLFLRKSAFSSEGTALAVSGDPLSDGNFITSGRSRMGFTTVGIRVGR